ncbi:MAG: type II toxin-antitoxin system Phd/YefM family antitoxin [Proteobacteria bacterium]|nr:type II toxin-antitoxin system Phd/YefM family antitoxin [Pseudomonadota bacterium]
MSTINIHEAKTHLSRLIERVLAGESLVIAKAGKPLAKLVRLDAPAGAQVRRLGFAKGQFKVPADFDRIGNEAIDAMFGGDA